MHLLRLATLKIISVTLTWESFLVLRYDLIDRPGVLENYVPVNYHSLYDLSVLVEGF